MRATRAYFSMPATTISETHNQGTSGKDELIAYGKDHTVGANFAYVNKLRSQEGTAHENRPASLSVLFLISY
jgi:hypothetical protein